MQTKVILAARRPGERSDDSSMDRAASTPPAVATERSALVVIVERSLHDAPQVQASHSPLVAILIRALVADDGEPLLPVWTTASSFTHMYAPATIPCPSGARFAAPSTRRLSRGPGSDCLSGHCG